MKTNKHEIKLWLGLAVVSFFLLYSFLALKIWLPAWSQYGHFIFNWPDATANFFFAKLFAQQGVLSWHEPLNLLTDNLLHARSINVLEGNLVPVSWLIPIVIFGFVFKVAGPVGLMLFTPLLAVLSGLLVYKLGFYIFKDQKTAWVMAILMWSLGPWLYFANIVMLPTVMFVFLVLAGWVAMLKSWHKDKYNLFWILGSLLLSLAVFVRPTEIVWLSLISVVVVYFNRDKLTKSKLISGGIVFSLVVAWFLLLNKFTYGAYLATGYFNLQTNSLSPEFSNSSLNPLKFLLFPFGFHPKLIASNFYDYFVKIAFPYLFLALVSLWWLIKSKNIFWRKYFIVTPIIFVLILVYYGSWDLADGLVKELNTISISYVRYFMPLYILILPPVAWLIGNKFLTGKKIIRTAGLLVLVVTILFSYKLAFLSKHDGLFRTKITLNDYYKQFNIVDIIVPEESVIITERSDKIFFPTYRVIAPQGDLPLWSRVAQISDQAKIYYYTDKNNPELKFDQQATDELNLDLVELGTIWANFRLFRVLNK